MNNTSKTPAPPQIGSQGTAQTVPQATQQGAPPEAYAAFVRIYMEWIEKGANGQATIVEKSVRSAKQTYSKYASSNGLSTHGIFGHKGSILYGMEFDEYVSQTWIEFKDKCTDVDEFAVYLQKDFEKKLSGGMAQYLIQRQKQFNNMKEQFLKKVFKKWDSDTQSLNGVALDTYLNNEYNRRSVEFAKMKKDFEDETMIIYPSLEKLLQKLSRNMISRQHYSVKKAANCADFTGEKGQERIPFETMVANRDAIERALATLDEFDNQIFWLWFSGYQIKEIAKEFGKANSTISTHIKKVLSKIKEQY